MKPIFTGKTYDILKSCALVVFPAFATLYFALAGIWGLPHAQEVVGTIVALDTFLGVVLQISSNAYDKNKYDGDLIVSKDKTGRYLYSLELNEDPEANLEDKKEIIFKVAKPVREV